MKSGEDFVFFEVILIGEVILAITLTVITVMNLILPRAKFSLALLK